MPKYELKIGMGIRVWVCLERRGVNQFNDYVAALSMEQNGEMTVWESNVKKACWMWFEWE